MPGPWENSTEGVQQALSINMETAVVVWNRMTGKKSLYQESGMYFPNAYEEVVKTVQRTRVLPQETMVVRNAFGRFVVHNGMGSSGTGSGTSFFVKPYEEIVEFEWSSFSDPPENGFQTIGKQTLTR